MRAKTTHFIPKNGGWAVRKEGSTSRGTGVYLTQKEAIEAAREIVQSDACGAGAIQTRYIHGLPEVQQPRAKSKLGSKAIERAVSAVLRERLSGD